VKPPIAQAALSGNGADVRHDDGLQRRVLEGDR
jgi:hypothetical protein